MKTALRLVIAAILLPAAALAGPPGPPAVVDPANFLVRDNGDLVALCAASPKDPLYLQAIHFCEGFGTGFVRYHAALTEGKEFKPLFCFPQGLTRDQAFAAYVAYSRARPEYDRETAADVFMKFLTDSYPCAAESPKQSPMSSRDQR